MNELIFFSHVVVVLAAVLGAVRLGKEALVTAIALQGVLANLFVIKQVRLFGLNVTSGDVYIIGSMLCLNLLQEFHGRKAVNKAVWISLGSLTLFALMGQFQLAYRPNEFDFANGAFHALLDTQPRIVAASLVTFFVVQQLDVRVFGSIRKRFTRVPLAVASGLSLLLCQAADTVLFAIMALYGMLESILDIMIVCFAIKATIIACMSPFTQLSKRFHRVEV